LWSLLIPEQKEKISELEQQAKKAEAAQRRRMQVEKAARESEVCSCLIIFHSFVSTLYLILEVIGKILFALNLIGRGYQKNSWSRF
jgi:hypothetical protein